MRFDEFEHRAKDIEDASEFGYEQATCRDGSSNIGESDVLRAARALVSAIGAATSAILLLARIVAKVEDV